MNDFDDIPSEEPRGDSDNGGYGSVSERSHIREQLNADIEAFLQRGGRITQVDDSVRADPPRRPEASYGSQPL